MPSALRPAPNGEGISIPEPPKEFTIDSNDEDQGKSNLGSPEPLPSAEPHVSHGRSSAPRPHILTQDKENDIVAIWSCPKAKQSY
jgi:hypothetical protein